MSDTPAPVSKGFANDTRIFWGSFIALVTSAFGFMVRTQVVTDWAGQFELSNTQAGSIIGVGLWPFALSIFVFSLVIDKVGYGRAAFVGLLLHIASTVMLLTAKNYQMLYWGTFMLALASGTVEAYINPVVASMYREQKTKWMNLLHAGWPGGIMLAGLLAIAIGGWDWQYKIALTLIPTVIYAVLLFGTRFPVSERVDAGVTYREMLADFGALGMFVAIYLITLQVFDLTEHSLFLAIFRETHEANPEAFANFHDARFYWILIPSLLIAGGFGAYTRSLGQPIYFLLLLIMLPLATTELGVDSWITALMEPEMEEAGYNAGWVLVYTVAIMTVLRLFAGPILHRVSPLTLLAVCSAIAIAGLLLLSRSAGMAAIFAAATVYGIGKSFFWPTMLGVVAERFPKGGSLSLNTIGGVGMLGLGIGGVFLGNIQDRSINDELAAYDKANQTALVETYLGEEKTSLLGKYRPVDANKVKLASEEDQQTIEEVQNDAKKGALATAAVLPCIMLVSYIGLIVYFRAKGGYKPEQLIQSEELS